MSTSFDQVANQYNFTPRLITVDDMNGGSLTRATIKPWTQEDIEAMFFKEVGMDRIIASTKEARMAGVRERSLTDLLLSRHVTLKQASGGGSQSVIAPFSLVPRRNQVNACYFQIEAGAAHPTAGQGSMPASAWQITVNTGSSPWVKAPAQGLKSLEKYFLPRCAIVVEWKDTVTGVARTANLEIIEAVNADAGSVSKAKVTVKPNKTASYWAGLTSQDKALFQPQVGQVTLLPNSISDFESYGHQYPAVIDVTLLEYWQQTIRWAHSYNEEYIEALKAPLTSDTCKKFRMLDLAKQRKQQEMIQEALFYNMCFYGDEISEKQTIGTWTQLPQVVDPADASYLIEYSSNTLGFRTQLNRAARINDRQGLALDLDAIFSSLYNLKRNREVTSGSIDRIDAMTDRHTKGRIRDIMIKYYKAKYSMDVTGYVQTGQKVMDVVQNKPVLEYDLYDIPDEGVQFAVFTDTYFDDRISAFAADQKSRARALWLLDWSDVMINTIKTNSAKRVTNAADELYRFVITPNVKHTMLNSKTSEVRLGEPNRSQLIENFSDDSPSLTVAGVDIG